MKKLQLLRLVARTHQKPCTLFPATEIPAMVLELSSKRKNLCGRCKWFIVENDFGEQIEKAPDGSEIDISYVPEISANLHIARFI